LGTRNRLINIPLRTKNIRAIEVADAKTSEVFRMLGEGKRFTFLATAPEESEALDPKALAQPSETEAQSRVTDRRLQTKLSPEVLQKRLLDIWYDARTLEEEQGVNILYLALGLMKWFEDDKSEVERLAPLVLLPVRLERTSAADRFQLVSRGEPPSPNLSLQAKMDGEFGLKIQDFGDEDDVDIVAYTPLRFRRSMQQRNVKSALRWALRALGKRKYGPRYESSHVPFERCFRINVGIWLRHQIAGPRNPSVSPDRSVDQSKVHLRRGQEDTPTSNCALPLYSAFSSLELVCS
jgi:hypothetical protein